MVPTIFPLSIVTTYHSQEVAAEKTAVMAVSNYKGAYSFLGLYPELSHR